MLDLVGFLRVCSRNGLDISDQGAHSLQQYVGLLLDWNRKLNLVSRRDQENLWSSHILHSVSPWFTLEPGYAWKVLDLGTGGGLPGIPLAILRPDLRVVLLDSIRKKTKAVEAMVSELGLSNARVVTGRAEDISALGEFKNSFDMVVVRAVSALPDLVLWAGGFLKRGFAGDSLEPVRGERLSLPGGLLVALKGGDLEKEIRQVRMRNQKSRIAVLPLTFDGSDELGLEDKSVVVVTFR